MKVLSKSAKLLTNSMRHDHKVNFTVKNKKKRGSFILLFEKQSLLYMKNFHKKNNTEKKGRECVFVQHKLNNVTMS